MESNSTDQFFKDFERDTEPKEAIPAVPETAPQPQFEPGGPEPADTTESGPEPKAKKKPAFSPETQAEFYIAGLDSAQTLLFKGINKRKMRRRFGDKLERAVQLFHEMEAGRLKPAELAPEDYVLFMRIRDLKQVEDEIPFSDDEYKQLQTPLAKVIEQSGYDLPPSMAISMAVMLVMAPRITAALME